MTKTSENELEPCPFCEGEADYVELDGATGAQFQVFCAPEDEFVGCLKQDTTYERLSDAAKAWNTRPMIKALRDENDKMRGVLLDAVECGMVPVSSAKDGGAASYSRQVVVADAIREILKDINKGKKMSKEIDELEPCPFCGGEVELEMGIVELEISCCSGLYRQITDSLPDGGAHKYYDKEKREYTEEAHKIAKQEAIKAWNTRPAIKAMRDENRELENSITAQGKVLNALSGEIDKKNKTIEKMRQALHDIKHMKIATADGELSDENSKWMFSFDKLDAEQLRNLLWHIRGVAQQALETIIKKGGE